MKIRIIPERGSAWREDLMCGVIRLSYDFGTRRGNIYFPSYDCCHMPACIALFAAIDPGVLNIQTWSGNRRDTSYFRTQENMGEWHSGYARTTTEKGGRS